VCTYVIEWNGLGFGCLLLGFPELGQKSSDLTVLAIATGYWQVTMPAIEGSGLGEAFHY
jgi:hypothetical protein